MTVDDPNLTSIDRDAFSRTDSGSTVRIPDLKPFADQLMAIAQHLREGDFPSFDPDKSAAPAKNPYPSDKPTRTEFTAIARRAYASRRKRNAIFGNADLFGEPAWDILLDLYIAQSEGKSVSVSSACIGSASPPTTGLRWLGVLAEQGLVIREQDCDDQRRVLVKLTERGIDVMDEYFASISAGRPTDLAC